MDKIDSVISGESRILIVGHIKPDGDCVGSCLGLWHYLHDNYEICADLFLEPFSEHFDFLRGDAVINPEREPNTVYDVVFALDCSERERIGAGSERVGYGKKLICIDHHISNTGFGDIDVIYPDYSSACEVLYTLLENEKLTYASAMCLYTGMVCDTGVFQYSSTGVSTMHRAGELMRFGFDHTKIITSVFFEKSLKHQRLLGHVLDKLILTEDKEGLITYVTLEEMEQFGCDAMETDGIVEVLRNTKGIDYSAFFYEMEPGTYKVSFRSKNKLDVSQLAVSFGGGGHVRASGCSFSGMSPEEIIAAITSRAAEQLND